MSAIGPELENPGTRAAWIALGSLVTFAFLYALNQLAWQFVKTIFGFLFHLPLVGGWIASHLHHVVSAINHWFGNNAWAIDRHLARSWHQIAGVFDFIGQMFLLLASLSWLLAHELRVQPYRIYRAIAGSPTATTARRADARSKRAGAAAAAAGATAGAIARQRNRSIPSPWKRWARAQAQNASIAGATTGAAVAERTIAAGRVAAGQRRRTGALEKALGALGVAALVDIGLRKLDLGHLRCRNNRRVGKALCGFPLGILEGLLGDALDVLLVTQLCRIVTLMTDGAKLAAPAFEALVAMVDDLIHCTGSARPHNFPLAVYAPPATASPLPLH